MSAESVTVPLHEIAHSREGDKGNWATISLIAYDPAAYPVLVEQVTGERVLEHFAHRGATEARRYELPRIHALNFAVVDTLEGGVNGSLNVDGHGKTLSFHLLSMEVTMPDDLFRKVRRGPGRSGA